MLCELLSLLCAITVPSCKGPAAKDKKPAAIETEAAPNTVRFVKSIQFVAPVKNDTCRFHQPLRVAYANNRRYPVDSAHVLYNNRRVATLDSATREYTLRVPPDKCGINNIKIIAFHPGNRQGSILQPIIVTPDKAPRRLTFDIINTYPHDPSASTQGLVYHRGYIYEGTGIQGESTLRKTDPRANRDLAMFSLGSEYFGEGITIYRDKIYQITWTSRLGFIYDLETFRQEGTFTYNTQGWGITTMGDTLVMSDGSHHLILLDPTRFNKIKTVEVYDHHGPVHSLNELEWINGRVWANVWLTDRIVIIDPASGAITEELYLPNMLTPAEKIKLNTKEDVLNGIAHDPAAGTIYITGKHWPKLFEIKTK
jgi:glutamine cyclotransferase